MTSPNDVARQPHRDAAGPDGEGVQDRKPIEPAAATANRDGQADDRLAAGRGDLGVDLVEKSCVGGMLSAE